MYDKMYLIDRKNLHRTKLNEACQQQANKTKKKRERKKKVNMKTSIWNFIRALRAQYEIQMNCEYNEKKP